jgi:hypothetical protein
LAAADESAFIVAAAESSAKGLRFDQAIPLSAAANCTLPRAFIGDGTMLAQCRRANLSRLVGTSKGLAEIELAPTLRWIKAK